MIVCIVASLLGGTTAYYIALAWTTAAIAFFEVSRGYLLIANHGLISLSLMIMYYNHVLSVGQKSKITSSIKCN